MDLQQRLAFFRETVACNQALYYFRYSAGGALLESDCPRKLTFDAIFRHLGYHQQLYQAEGAAPIIFCHEIGLCWIAGKEMAGDDAYSYSYQSAVGLLDHALANSTMAGQVTGCSVFHINADEAAMYGYDGSRPGDDMYRSSDHDPVVVGIRLADDADVVVPDNSVAIVHGREEPGLFTVLNADRHYMKIVSVGGIVMCDTQITSDAQTFDARALGLGAGVYVLQFTEIKAIEPKQFVRKLILTE